MKAKVVTEAEEASGGSGFFWGGEAGLEALKSGES